MAVLSESRLAVPVEDAAAACLLLHMPLTARCVPLPRLPAPRHATPRDAAWPSQGSQSHFLQRPSTGVRDNPALRDLLQQTRQCLRAAWPQDEPCLSPGHPFYQVGAWGLHTTAALVA